jgi:glucose-1-phosphate thymidylyltransferase
MRGIILAGGEGKRLYPNTISLNKHLIPVFDKPMIYYPLSVLMLAKIKDILIISKKDDVSLFRNLLGDGKRLGISIKYTIQNRANGIAEAFKIGKNFIGREDVCLILGDNILYSDGLVRLLNRAKQAVKKKKASIFGYKVKNTNQFGIIEFKGKKIQKIIEKPKKTNSKLAVIGLYFYPNKVLKYSNAIKKSKRSEFEITDINNIFLENNKIEFNELGRGSVWYDAGSPENLIEISNLIFNIQNRNNTKIACIEEISFRNKWINKKMLTQNLKFTNGGYRKYLLKILNEK